MHKYKLCLLIDVVTVFVAAFVLCCTDRILGAMVTKGEFSVDVLVRQVLPFALIAIVPIGVLGRHSRWLYMPLFSLLAVLELAEWFYYVNFNQRMGGEIIGVLFGSSMTEALSFVREYSHPVVLMSFACVICGLAAYRVSKRLERFVISKKGMAFSLVGVVIAGVMLLTAPSAALPDWRARFPVFNLIIDFKMRHRVFEQLIAMKRHPRLPSALRMDNERGAVTGVFVIGESSTRNRWGLYGYATNTTPNLCARKGEVVVFKDVQGVDCYTWLSMIYLTTTKTHERRKDCRYSLSQALTAAGCRASLHSNQYHWGLACGEDSFIFAGCNPVTYLDDSGRERHYDGELLGYMKTDLWSRSGNQVVFLHTVGSHFNPRDMYPHGMAPFADHYDNSVWYTDYILERIIRELESHGGASWMIYISDHGETPSSGHWRDPSDRDLWEIPFVIWTSKEFRDAYPERIRLLESAKSKPLRIDWLQLGLLRFMGVVGLNEDPKNDFLDDGFESPIRKERWMKWKK